METVDDRISKKMDRRKLLKGLGIGGAIGTSFVLGNRLGVAEATTTQYPISFGSYASSSAYTIFQDATKTYAKNGRTGAIDFSALTSGDFTANIMQPIINALSTTEGGTSTYARGGIVTMYAGDYNSTTPWVLPTSTSKAFDITLQGSGKSNTLISINPSSPQTYAIGEGYTEWVNGINGPRFVMRDLSLQIGGTYSGTSAPAGDSSGGGVMSLQFYSVFLEHVQININVVLTSPTNMLKCGTYAGPSQPCTWNDVDFYAFAGENLSSVVAVWFEGFSWRGGEIDLQMSGGYSGTGINVLSNGPNYLGQIDSYDAGAPNNWMNFVKCTGITTLDELEYPSLSTIYAGVNGGTIWGVGSYLTVIGIEEESAVGQGNPANFTVFPEGMQYFKTIGFSLGLQSGAQWNSSYLTGPFSNNVSGTGYIVGLNTYNGEKVPTASTTYKANTDIIINCSGGTGVSITISDCLGNAMVSGLTSLSQFRMSIGMKINFGAFSVAPTVAIFQVAG